jgi:hypothetical protein
MLLFICRGLYYIYTKQSLRPMTMWLSIAIFQDLFLR